MDTLSTKFFYNSLNLPSKRSCAQDYWGYYNGQNNASTALLGIYGHTMIPTPNNFMSYNYNSELADIRGADRNSRGDYMQATMLNRVVYPTGGYTTYEYEPNTCRVGDYRESLEYEEFIKRPFDVSVHHSYSYTPDAPVVVTNTPVPFTVTDSLSFSLDVRCGGSAINGHEIAIIIVSRSTENTRVIPVEYNSSNDYCTVLQDTLPPGNYELTIGAPGIGDQNYGIGCWLRGYYRPRSFFDLYPQNIYSRAIGGLRVNTIRNYDNDGQKLGYTTFDYNNSGILLNSIETIEPYSYTYLKSEPNGWGPLSIYSRHYISGWNITSGQSRFPAFFASCNPGDVGYSQITKRTYNGRDNLEKTEITSYINHKPEGLGFLDYYKCLDNGKLLSKEIYDANGTLVSKTENTYRFHDLEFDDRKDKWYSTNMVAKDMLRIDPYLQYFNESEFPNRFLVWKYPYIQSWIELTKTTNKEYCPDGSVIEKTQEFAYNLNRQVSRIDETVGDTTKIQRTEITYSGEGKDYISQWMKDGPHRLSDVVETRNILRENGEETCLDTKHIVYGSHYDFEAHKSRYLPVSTSTSIGDNPLETRATYSYDDSLNVRSVTIDGMETVYIWSYKGQYPIAKITGLTYAEVESAIGATTLSTLLGKPEPTQADLRSIHDAINAIGGLVTTYTHKPLVGILSETQPNGHTIYYEYDGFGRLTRVLDHNGHTISTNSYNYKR